MKMLRPRHKREKKSSHGGRSGFRGKCVVMHADFSFCEELRNDFLMTLLASLCLNCVLSAKDHPLMKEDLCLD